MPPRARAVIEKASRVGVRQWLSLVAAIWLQSVNGTNSNFPAYSSQLKQAMTISQLQLNNLAFANDAGKLLGWISGIATLYLPLWTVLFLGALLGLVSYGVQYLFLSGHFPVAEISYPLIFFLTVLAGNSICWINTVCYAVIIASFSSGCRQVAVGLSTSYQGLSANIYTDIVDVVAPAPKSLASPQMTPTLSGRRANTYLLLNAIMPAIVSIFTSFLVRDDKGSLGLGNGDDPNYQNHSNDSRRSNCNDAGVSRLFAVLFAITILTGLYAVLSSLGAISASISPVYNVVGMGLLLMAPLVIPLLECIWGLYLDWCMHDFEMAGTEAGDDQHLGGAKLFIEKEEGGLVIVKEERSQVQRQGMHKQLAAGGLVPGSHNAILESGYDDQHKKISSVKEEVGWKSMLIRIDFWVYFFTYLCGATLGLVYLNNLGQITESRGSSRTSAIVSLSSGFSFFGRLLPSLLDYVLYRQKCMVSRQACVVALMVPMTGSFFLLLNSSNLCFYISTAVISLCTGAITSISVSITTELFGTKNFSVNHNIVVGNIPIGSFLFGYIAAVLYHRAGNADGKCIGMECYHNTFIIWGCLCFLGTNLSLLLYARSHSFFHQRSTGRS